MDKLEFLNAEFAKMDKHDTVRFILNVLTDLTGYYGGLSNTALQIGIEYDTAREYYRLLNAGKPRVPSGDTTLRILGAWIQLRSTGLMNPKNLCFTRQVATRDKTTYVCEPRPHPESGDAIIYDNKIGTLTMIEVVMSDDHDPMTLPFIDFWDNQERAQVREKIEHRVIGKLAPLHDEINVEDL